VNMNDFDKLTHGKFKGIAVIEDHLFEEVSFNSFAINPVEGAQVIFKNCIFKNCMITKGCFQLGKYVTLDNVTFDNLKSNGHFDINSAVKITATKFINSSKDSFIWIQDILGENVYSSNKIDLDISQFNGEVIITGVDVSDVVMNSNKHIVIKKNLLELCDFKVSRANFFRSSASKVKANGGECGIFSLPKSKRETDDFIKQLLFLKNKGCVK
jgi:hypothetical protein